MVPSDDADPGRDRPLSSGQAPRTTRRPTRTATEPNRSAASLVNTASVVGAERVGASSPLPDDEEWQRTAVPVRSLIFVRRHQGDRERIKQRFRFHDRRAGWVHRRSECGNNLLRFFLRAYLVRKRHGRVLWSHLWYHSGFVVSLVVPLVGAQALAEDHVSGPERGSDEAAIFACELNHTVRSVVF